MNQCPGPTQICLENWPIVEQLVRLLLLQVSQKRVLTDALAVPCGEPDPIELKTMAIGAEHSPVTGAPSGGTHLAVVVEVQRASSLGLPELGSCLRRHGSTVAGL